MLLLVAGAIVALIGWWLLVDPTVVGGEFVNLHAVSFSQSLINTGVGLLVVGAILRLGKVISISRVTASAIVSGSDGSAMHDAESRARSFQAASGKLFEYRTANNAVFVILPDGTTASFPTIQEARAKL